MVLLKKRLLSQSALVAVLLTVCVAGYGIRGYELVRPASSVSVADPAPALKPLTTTPTGAISPQDMAELNLFGDVKPTAIITPHIEFNDVPKTKLDLTLNAVFADTSQARASAVIATQNNSRAERYFIGEMLPGNVTLYAIYPGHVILKRGGRLEKLVFPRDRPE